MNDIPDYLPLQSGMIYGPVNSRRLGSSLGVNVLPSDYKLCGFNCVYCQYGPTTSAGYSSDMLSHDNFVAPTDIEEALRSVLALYPDVSYITFSGNGEATLHPDFPEMVERVTSVRDSLAPRAKTAILSNSCCVGRQTVREAILKLDKPIMKLDAGSKDLFLKINRPRPEFEFDQIVDGLIRLEHTALTIQTMLFSGDPSNVDRDNIEAWAKIVGRIKPAEVQVYTVQRPPAESGIFPVATEILEKIASTASDISGVPVIAY
jgi:wyosine [tRNA(Phe)-imidazoG37] synthetase (radical SAM superfamily)